jgi:copper chaperone CopZ
MTDRTRILTVVLDHDYREDDVRAIIDAIKMVKGVAAVDMDVADPEQYMAIETAKRELQTKIYEVLS